MENKKLIFVYNADSDLFSTVSDFAHKIISPKTYACSLCALTFGNFGMKKEWAEYIKTLHPTPEFLHKDEFVKQYESSSPAEFPAIFLLDEPYIEMIITPEELNQCKSITELKTLLKKKM